MDVIQRVAERRGPSEAAADAAGRDDLGFLIPMLHPWPYGRYRFPNLLLEAWLVGD